MCEDLSLIPQTMQETKQTNKQAKLLGLVICPCNPITAELDTGKIPGVYL